LEIASALRYPPTMPSQTGPKTNEGKAVTRLNSARHGVYSVTPVLPKVERQADWLQHHDSVFADVAPDGYVQEIIAERIALNSWRLRRLVRYEREQVRNRHRNIATNLALNAVEEGRKLQPEPLDEDLDRLDRWFMDALVPYEKELMLLMRWEGRLVRDLRRDLLHMEHMQRQRRENGPFLRPAEPEPQPVLSAPMQSGQSKGPAEPESLGEPLALRQLN